MVEAAGVDFLGGIEPMSPRKLLENKKRQKRHTLQKTL